MTTDESLRLHIIAPTYDPATVGGAGVVLTELVDQFLARAPQTKIYLNPGAAELFPQWREAIVLVPVRSRRGARPAAADLARLLVAGSTALPATGEGVRWYPFGFATPFWSRARAVLTLYDTLDRDLPETLPLIERTIRRLATSVAARRARVVTASNFSRGQIRRHYGVDPEVIPLATISLPPPAPAPPGETAPYVFFPANAWAHKNHRFLLDLWRTEPALRGRYELVFTMGGGEGALGPALQATRAAGARVRITGHITPAELAAHYRSAACLAFPSLYEGFGLPVAEALQCGCPALISDQGSLPETVPAGYPLILPLEPARWTAALLAEPRRLLPDFRVFVPTTTWAEVADRYFTLFRQLAAP